MLAAIRGSYVQFVEFMGVAERYPEWFIEEIVDRIFVDESRFCFWSPPTERTSDYYERELIETYSIVVRKNNGEAQVMEMGTFKDLYHIFTYDQFENCGVAAFGEDVVEYVECSGGYVIDSYPEWFYEYFTESLNNPRDGETYLLTVNDDGFIEVKERCVFLRNRFGEIKQMSYDTFLKYYDPGVCYPRQQHDKNWWEDCPF